MTAPTPEEVLRTFAPDADRGLIVWAIGAYTQCHALPVYQFLNGRFHTDMGGSSLGICSPRWLEYDSREVWIRPNGVFRAERSQRLVSATWREIGRALRVDAALHAEIRDTLAERNALNGRYQSAAFRRLMRLTPEQAAERDTYNTAARAIERRCYSLGEAAWQGCRPPEQAEPADLLELLAAMGAA